MSFADEIRKNFTPRNTPSESEDECLYRVANTVYEVAKIDLLNNSKSGLTEIFQNRRVVLVRYTCIFDHSNRVSKCYTRSEDGDFEVHVIDDKIFQKLSEVLKELCSREDINISFVERNFCSAGIVFWIQLRKC